MNREFFINIFFLIFINVLIKPFYIFGIDRTIQNTVEAGEYGLYFALFNFTFLFQIINDMGIQNYNARNIAQNPHLVQTNVTTIIAVKGILAVIYFIIILIAASLSNYSSEYYYLLFPIALNQVLVSVMLYLRSNISGLGLYRTDSVISVIDKILLILICGILLWHPYFNGQFQIQWLVYSQTTTLFLTILIAFVVIWKKVKLFRFQFNFSKIVQVLKQSFPYGLTIFLMTAYSRTDGVMIERLLPNGKFEADIYASAFRLLDAVSMIGFLFAGLLLPMLSRLIKENKSIHSLVQQSVQLILAGAITLAGSVYFFQEEIMVLLYDTGGVYSGKILGYLMISYISICGIYIYGTVIGAGGDLKLLNIVALVGFIANILLNISLIPYYQALGAAIATCVTQFFVLIGHIIITKQKMDLRNDFGMLARIGGFIIVVIFFGKYLHQWQGIEWTYRFLTCLIICGLAAFVFQLINLLQLKEMFISKATNA